jgi:hypothetical protein
MDVVHLCRYKMASRDVVQKWFHEGESFAKVVVKKWFVKGYSCGGGRL